MNKGGFSWSRLLGISAAKSKISRAIGVPLTKSGRERKLGAAMGNLAVGLFSAATATKKVLERQSSAVSVTSNSKNDCNRREILNKGIAIAYDDVISRIKYSTIPHGDIPVTEEEKTFIISLIIAMVDGKVADEELTLTRLSDKTFNVDCTTCYIGKIKLQGTTYIQVLKGSKTIKEFRDISLEKCLEQIPAWIRYVKYCRRN